MVRSLSTVEEVVIRRHKFWWPDQFLQFWILIMLGTSGVLLGIFANFVSIQNQFEVGIPWLFPFSLTTASINIVFIVILLLLIAQKSILPLYVLMGSFILFALFLTGLIETGIQVFGPNGNVNNVCNTYVNAINQKGASIYTLAWLEQKAICNQWYTVFAFYLIACLFLIWIFVVGILVSQGRYNR